MKYAEKLFPKGSFKDQKTDGAYIDGTLAENLDIFAKRIIDDMHFLILISGNDMVGNGKTTIGTQVGAYLTNKINELHNLNNSFTSDNVVFKGGDLSVTSFKLPKLSVVLLDESDDLKEHAMKDTTLKLKRYFRKCRQQNQILILITPSFFELSKFYALARSHCLINVKFYDDFRRGTFDFYGANSKKKLYLKGKKEWNYDVQREDFSGMFSSSYTFFPDLDDNIKKYKARKYYDMEHDADDDAPENWKQMEIELRIKLFGDLYTKLGDVTIKRIADGFGVSERTGKRYLSVYKMPKDTAVTREGELGKHNINHLSEEMDDDEDEGEEETIL